MFFNIQMLRAIAALLVFLHHAIPHYEAMGGNLVVLSSIGQWGFVGVDIFFVISGFVIARTALAKGRTFANAVEFGKHRFLRIYLGYWPFLLIYSAIILATEPDKIGALSWWDSVFLSSADMFKLVLPVAWSLSFEIYFYFIFVLSFLLPASAVKKLLYLVFFAVLLRSVLLPFPADPVVGFLLSEYMMEFFAGAILYTLVGRFYPIWLIPVAIGVAVATYTLGVVLRARSGPIRIYTFGVGAVAVVMAGLLLEENGIYKAGRLFVELGNASYTIYLSHLAFLAIFYVSGARTLLSRLGHPMIEVGFLGFLFLVAALSVLFHRYVEKPIYKYACSIRLPTRFFKEVGVGIKPES